MIDGGDYRTGDQRACDNEHVEAQAEVKRLKERLEVVVKMLSTLSDLLRVGVIMCDEELDDFIPKSSIESLLEGMRISLGNTVQFAETRK